MGQLLVYILIIVFVIRTIRNTLYQVFLWQLKEYRLDRMLAHLKTRQGKRMVFGLVSLVKWGLLAGYFAGLQIFWPVVFVYILEAMRDLGDLGGLRGRSWKRPVWTIKATVVVAGGILGSLGGLGALGVWANWANLNNLAVRLLFLDKILAPAIGLFFLLLSIPTKIQRKMIIEQAKTIILKHPNLITIGITGSYGKTSTKEFLTQILSQKFRVLKTEGSQNTEIGVAKTIVEKLKDQEIFVCEMGAYKIGEIREICEMVQPKIGIITGINEQHLDLFGSLKNTMKAKYELIESLPQAGLAVFNGSNQYCLEMAEKARKINFIKNIKIINEDIKAEEIKVFKDKLEFKVFKGLKFQEMTAHLLGRQNVENILLAICVAQDLGMSLEEIAKAVGKLEAPEKTMRVVSGGQGRLGESGVLVDDSFNTNPDGVLAAIEYVKIYSGKKILILTPMIELGEAAGTAHEKAGRLAGEVCDLVILTNKNYYEDFMKGIKMDKMDKTEKIMVANGKKAAEKIKAILDENGVAVFEGKEAERILKQVQNDKKYD